MVLSEHDLTTSHDCLDPDYGCEEKGAQCEADQMCAPTSLVMKGTVRLLSTECRDTGTQLTTALLLTLLKSHLLSKDLLVFRNMEKL